MDLISLQRKFYALVGPPNDYPNRAGLKGCRPWYGSFNDDGYGQFHRRAATHWVMEWAGQPCPAPHMKCNHRCENVWCVSLPHLEWVTDSYNKLYSIKDWHIIGRGEMRERHKRNRRQTPIGSPCYKGHPRHFVRKTGAVRCAVCADITNRAWMARKLQRGTIPMELIW